MLVAEDDDEMRVLLEAVLRCAGYVVTAVDSGSALLAAFDRATSVSAGRLAVVSDVMMSGEVSAPSGLEVLAEIRKRGSKVPVILISGFADGTLRKAAERWAVTDFLSKPFDMELLVEALGRATMR